jgi:hypothetical protein
MTRQPNLDAPAVRCAYARRPTERPNCQLSAVVKYGNTTLCADCDTRRSTLGKATPGHRLPPGTTVDVIQWLTQADQRLHQASTELAAAAWHARTQGHTWTAIGAALNITKQAAQQRFRQDQLRKG